MSWILAVLVGVVLAAVHQAESSGVFELRLISFDNEAGKDDLGKCCSGLTGPNSECEGMCRPRFRVCLKEYQVKIDTTSPCTFGDVITTELEPNPGMDAPQNGFDNSIAFPFPFTWPGTFSLIVEAWHGNQTSHSAVLVSRLTRQKWLDVSDKWTEDVHSSKYSTLKFEYRVTCKSHYYGKGCEKMCRPRDDNFGHYSCSPTGDRVCLAGWTGEYCTKPRCLPGCDEQHGHCTKPNECRCQSGWEGPLCDQCQRYPGCMHGTCVKPWDCLCNEGWGGLFCNQDLNFCTNHKPCRNGGTCFNTGQGSYTCSCPAGYTGTNCETSLHDCAKTPCLNGGTCRRNGTANACECLPGHGGPRCEASVRTCKDDPCQNDGVCTDKRGGAAPAYECECRPGFDGPECQHRVDGCASEPCRNGGSCAVDEGAPGGFRCVCLAGFAGDKCETNVDDCPGNPCRNGGTCVDLVNAFRCKCVPGYVGTLCQSSVDYCTAKPCANGGTCLQLINDYKCKCAPGFTGKDCSEEESECEFQHCRNGGTCFQLINDYKCKCAPGFAGKDCSEEVDECESLRRCQNGGTCLQLVAGDYECKCAPGFAGKNCSEVTAAAATDGCRSTRPCQNGGVCVEGAAGGSECRCPPGFLGAECEQVSSSAAPSARVSSESNLTTEHVIVIATISTFVPLLVLVAVGVIVCLKQRRKREKARADEEARLQNEQNTANSSFAKRGGVTMSADAHMIKNSWGKCTNNVVGSNVSSPDDCSISNISVTECDGFPKPPSMHHHQVIDGRPVYSLQRTRSQKQLNTEPGPRASALLAVKLHEPEYEHIKRLSVMSNASAVCGSSDPSLLKRPAAEKESKGVYVIEEHFHRPDAISAVSTGLFATEV